MPKIIGSVRYTPAVTIKLPDQQAEVVRQNVQRQLDEVKKSPAAGMLVLGDFVVPNSGSVLVSHGLGRAPAMVILSPPRVVFGTPGLVTGGILVDLTGPDVDRTQQIRIFAAGYGIAVTVTVAVM